MRASKLYYFTTEENCGESVLDSFVGTLEEAQKLAQMVADELQQNVYINSDEDIVDVVYPNKID